MNLIFIEIFIMNATLLTNMISVSRVMSIYISFISVGVANLVATAAGDVILFVFPFSYPKLGT